MKTNKPQEMNHASNRENKNIEIKIKINIK